MTEIKNQDTTASSKEGTQEHSRTAQASVSGAKEQAHGFKTRGNVFTGIVVSDKSPKTVKVERILTHYVPKYERYKKVRSRITAHNPENMNARVGDRVVIEETRKISKTKSFIVTKIVERKKQ